MSAGEGAFPSMLVPWRRCDTLWSVSSCLFALAMDGVCFLNLYFHFRMASLFTVVTVMKDQSSEAFVEGSYPPSPTLWFSRLNPGPCTLLWSRMLSWGHLLDGLLGSRSYLGTRWLALPTPLAQGASWDDYYDGKLCSFIGKSECCLSLRYVFLVGRINVTQKVNEKQTRIWEVGPGLNYSLKGHACLWNSHPSALGSNLVSSVIRL